MCMRVTFSALGPSGKSSGFAPVPHPHLGLSLRRRLFAADGAEMCWTFDALARWLARRVRLGSPEGRAGGQLSPQRSIDNSMTAQKQLQGSMNRLNDSPTVPQSHRRRARFLLAASDAHAHTRHYRALTSVMLLGPIWYLFGIAPNSPPFRACEQASGAVLSRRPTAPHLW